MQNSARFRMPDERSSITKKFTIKSADDNDIDGYVTVGFLDDGTVGEIFIMAAKEGDTIRGLLDALSIAVSVGLQHGVPLETFVDKFSRMGFEPSGMTHDPQPLTFVSSIVDYIFRWIGTKFTSIDGGKE